MDKPKVYIAGPISGYQDLNRSSFYKAQEAINALGFDVSNPHEFCIDIKSEDSSDPKFYRRGFAVLITCSDILLLEGWQYSAGAQLERKVAVLCRMGVHESIDDLVNKYSTIIP